MIKLSIPTTTFKDVELTNKQAKEVTFKYLQLLLGGQDYYVTSAHELEDWTSYPHGSGTTTKHGPASELQIQCQRMIAELRKFD